MANGFMGKEGQSVPEMSDEWISTISGRYIELYEKLIGEPFIPDNISDEETYNKVVASLNSLP
jgi:phosphoribosylaminoimidazole-succinocarboxamide synthase